MRHLILIGLFIIVAGTASAKEIDNNNPIVRQGIIQNGFRFFSEGKFSMASQQFYYGIITWNKPDQLEDKKNACRALFTLLFYMGTVSKYKHLLNKCPAELTKLWFGKDNRNYVPLLKAKQCYPEKAFKNKLEGSVIVQFNINKDGRTRDVKVVNSSNPIFNKCAVLAAKKYLYLPAIKDGKKMITYNVKNKLDWKLNLN